MQQSYPSPGQYDRSVPYNVPGYNSMSRVPNVYPPQLASAYNQPYPMQSYHQDYNYQEFPPAGNGMYNAPAVQRFVTQNVNYMNRAARGRGRGGYYPPGRVGFTGEFRGGRGGFRHKKRPFVGGTLETQKEWERQTQCCFFKQGKCKFGDGCRFVHQGDSTFPCQFGENCRVHATGAKGEAPEAEASNQKVAEAPTIDNAEATESAEV